MKTTISVLKADVGSYPGHVKVHPNLLKIAKDMLGDAKGMLTDFHVTNCGDDMELIMIHQKGEKNQEVHKLAFDVFMKCTEEAKRLKLYGAGQDMLKTAFSGNLKGMGPGICEMEFEERKSEPIIVFMADKTSPGAWNLPFYKMFADPFNTVGLIIDPTLNGGFTFEIHDLLKGKKVGLKCPEETYGLLSMIGAVNNYVVKKVFRNSDGEVAASSSTERLSLIAGKYVGKDDPVCIVRCQSGFPAVGEVLEAFAYPHLVPGWMRGSHWAPIMPVGQKQATPTRFDGPPRVMAFGFQVHDGLLEGPV
ncbi:MAG: fructose-1,6-bisphosphatase, partial [Candidatus Aenigmatarchaeota archaeon]